MSQALVLVVDDEPDIRELVREILEDEGYAVVVAEDVATAREVIDEKVPDLVLLDIWMPDQDGISLLKEWHDAGAIKFPVVMISGHGTVETAVEATRLGAVDFIEKPLSLARLLLTVEKAMSNFELQNVAPTSKALTPIIGNSEYCRELRAQIDKTASQSFDSVMIQGERATGKQLVARHIHTQGSRNSQPFVVLRCDSLSDANAMRELLGNENSAGFFESASTGTLCLVDVEELPPVAQQLLLEALDTGVAKREDGVAVALKAAVISCASEQLQRTITQGDFRQDLMHKLTGFVIHTRPLREHPEDVPLLLTYYVDRLVEQDGLPYRHFSVGAQNRLRNLEWRGNILELINFVQRLLIVGQGVEIDQDEVDSLLGADKARDQGASGDTMQIPLDLPLREARAEFERLYLQRQLDSVDGNIVDLARIVGMERTHLYRKLRSVGIQAGRKRG
jgi:DNA-binding NtrC family response regulator